jgi:pimeloyl-ACP methyl ester carboxylesterase
MARRRRQVWPSRQAARLQWLGKEIFARWERKALELYLAEGLEERTDGQVELKCPAAVEAAIFEASLAVDLWTIAERVRARTLIQWAKQGDFGRQDFDKLAQRLIDARVIEVDSGHLVPMERPDCVAEAVIDFATQER